MRKECKEFGDFLRKVFSYAFVGLDNYKPPVICFIGVKVRNMKKDFNTGALDIGSGNEQNTNDENL